MIMISKKIIIIAAAVCSVLVLSVGIYVYSNEKALQEKEEARQEFMKSSNAFGKIKDPDLSF